MVISMLRRRELKNPQRYDRAGRHLANGPRHKNLVLATVASQCILASRMTAN
jgi:hypothetical protein